MDKGILQDYIDACELVKETEAEIRRLNGKKRTVVQTKVKGSSPNFPYIEQRFKIEGTAFSVEDDSHLRYEERVLAQRKGRAEQVKYQVDEWLGTVPLRMQRIIRYRYLDGLTWEQVAAQMGRRATGDSVRKELKRFFEKI
ncbi:MAG: RNA polymerase subunit sigma-70 [Lachnospiraceae bacterium]|nr:RNA polymerase subunit sigma-70 [Lachnospiraceae bacterium]